MRINRIRYGNIKIIFVSMLLISFLLLYIYLNNPLLLVLFFILSSSYFLFSRYDNSIYLFLSIVPFYKLISYGDFELYIVFCFIFAFIYISKKYIFKKSILVLYFSFIIYFLIMYSFDGMKLSQSLFPFLYILVALVITNEIRYINVVKLVYFFSLGLFLSSIIALFSSGFPSLEVIINNDNYHIVNNIKVLRFSGLESDPNFYSLLLFVSIANLLIFLYYNVGSRIASVLFIIIFMTFGFTTLSITFLFSSFLLFAIILVFYLLNRKNYTLFLLLAILILFIMNLDFMGDILSNLKFRLLFIQNSNLNDASSNRIYLWEYFYKYIIENINVFLLGEGSNIYSLNGFASHNFFLDLVYRFGIIGTIIYLLIVLQMFGISIQKRVSYLTIKIFPLLVFMIYISTLSAFMFTPFNFIIIVLALVFRYDFNKDTIISTQNALKEK